jgi:hypothetical protein
VLAQDMDVDVTVPGMRVKVRNPRVRTPRPQPEPVYVAPQPSYAMVDFAAGVEAVNAESFGDAKLDVVRTVDGFFTVDQLGQLVDLFSFSDEKVEVVAIVKPRLVDPQNAFKLYSRFTFDDDKKSVKAILGK